MPSLEIICAQNRVLALVNKPKKNLRRKEKPNITWMERRVAKQYVHTVLPSRRCDQNKRSDETSYAVSVFRAVLFWPTTMSDLIQTHLYIYDINRLSIDRRCIFSIRTSMRISANIAAVGSDSVIAFRHCVVCEFIKRFLMEVNWVLEHGVFPFRLWIETYLHNEPQSIIGFTTVIIIK